jgi:hypothetical protein
MNSDECLKNARECMEMADRVKSAEAKSEYLQLANAWMQLAEEYGPRDSAEIIELAKRAN